MSSNVGKKPADPKVGDLCVWHNPQVGAVSSFFYPVPNLETAKLVINMLADYDLWQYENRIKGDYANATGLIVYEGALEGEEDHDGWFEWSDEHTGYDINELMRYADEPEEEEA